MRTVIICTLFLGGVPTINAQNFDPPKVKPPDAATIETIVAKTGQLREIVAKAVKAKPKVAPDLDIYVKAAEYIVRHQEWLQADSGKQTLAVIDQGTKRAEAVLAGQTPWLESDGKTHVRAYRSTIDGSLQPYAVWLPANYGKERNKQYRLDIMLHGRDGSLTEVKFLNQHNGKDTPKTQAFVQIDIYGRGNNAYRWAGEQDVLEAMNDFLAREREQHGRPMIDTSKIVLKGFSMGGAGTWHIGLRRPGLFAAIQPGAGFTTTHGYIAGLPNPLPAHQEACLKIYDAINYADNAACVPIVAYSGEIDKQRLAAENIEKRVKELKLTARFTHLIGPGLEHKFPPEWQQAAEKELQRYVGGSLGRPAYPEQVHFTTYTPMHGACDWVNIIALEKQYEKATIDATYQGNAYTIKTANVRSFTVRLNNDRGVSKFTIDGLSVALGNKNPSASVHFTRHGQTWKQEAAPAGIKNTQLCGPIDHAFTGKFLCVVGTKQAFTPAMEQAALAQLNRFRKEWDKYMRGTLVVKKDTEVTKEDRETSHLILFGDPNSNSVIAEMLPKLPLKWSAKELVFAGQTYDAASHLPILIFPASADRYVVLNSGHTFHDAEFRGTNAQLYPRLGDYAIVKPAPMAKDPAALEVITAGLFDEQWTIPTKK